MIKKTKNQREKLKLNKRTVINLSHADMKHLMGGGDLVMKQVSCPGTGCPSCVRGM